jgi:hypothetical protein
MKDKEPKDRAASVRARLLNLARGRGEDFQLTLRNYLFERFLYRLSCSPLRERFVLKGAMLLRLWAEQPYRATVDLDVLSRGSSEPAIVARDIAAICTTEVPDDAVAFDVATISLEPIRADEEYAGVRVMFDARLDTIRERLQIDVGSAMHCGLGRRRSRIRSHWATRPRSSGPTVQKPSLQKPPIGLTAEFWSQPGRDAQVKAFARRARLEASAESARELGLRVAEFAVPILRAALRRD